ncbi:MAG: hypothetical protein ABEH81_16265 [Halopenitus sp.]
MSTDNDSPEYVSIEIDRAAQPGDPDEVAERVEAALSAQEREIRRRPPFSRGGSDLKGDASLESSDGSSKFLWKYARRRFAQELAAVALAVALWAIILRPLPIEAPWSYLLAFVFGVGAKAVVFEVWGGDRWRSL